MTKGFLKSKKIATIIGYASIVLTTLSNFYLTRVYLIKLGTDGYGLYQMIYSIAQYILILDMGISTVMVRRLIDYRERKDTVGEENFVYHMCVILSVIMGVILVACLVLNSLIERIYTTLSPAEYAVSHKMFLIITVSLSLMIVEHFLRGIINSREYFGLGHFLTIMTTVIKFVVVLVLLKLGIGVISVAAADLITKIVIVLFALFICIFRIKFKVKRHYFDKRIISSVVLFMMAMLLQSLSTFANNAIDKTILGIMMTKTEVAIYALAMTFISVYNMMPTIFTNMFLPESVRIKNSDSEVKPYTELIIKVGRFQFAICGLMLVGFTVCGKDFIALMYGAEQIQAWEIALIIMIPGLISLSEAALNGVIDANDKRMLFSKMVLAMSVLNIILTAIMVKQFGILGAPVSTAISYFSYYIIVRNIVAKKLFGLDLKKMIIEIPKRIAFCLLISSIPSVVINIIYPQKYTLVLFLIKAGCVVILFSITMFVYGFNKQEKNSILRMLKFKFN